MNPIITRWARTAVSGAVACLLASACATNPVTGEREFSLMSEAQEVQIGREYDVEIRREMGVYDDPELQAYVEQIGLTLAQGSHRPSLPWHFTIVDAPVVNAFALPGGYIYVTRGLLAYLADEAELAGVLGHEIGHVTARHAAQAYTRAAGAELGLLLGGIFAPATQQFGGLAQTGLGLLFLKYGRDDELQADRVGAEYAAGTGWDPQGVPDMLTTLARMQEGSERGIPNWLSTHPDPLSRVSEIEETVARLTAVDGDQRVNREGYFQRIQGLVFGDNPEEGIIRGNEFLHPVLRFAVEFPEGWEIINTASQVIARLPGNDVGLTLQLVEGARGRTLEDVAVESMRAAGFTRTSGQSTRINGLDAYVGSYQADAGNDGLVRARAGHFVQRGSTFVLVGLAREAEFPRVESAFNASIRSFRPLAPDEARQVRPNQLALYRVGDGETWQSIAQRAGQENVSAATLAIMNGYDVNEQPRRGDRIKIVVAG